MKQFDFNSYLKNNPLLKESIDEASKKQSSPKELSIVKKMNDLASIYGLVPRKLSKSSGNLALWADDVSDWKDVDNHVTLSKNGMTGELFSHFANNRFDDLEYGKKIIDPKTWDKYFKKSGKSSSLYDIKQIEAELEEITDEIYRIEEELEALEDEGEYDNDELTAELNNLHKLKDKLIAKLNKLKGKK